MSSPKDYLKRSLKKEHIYTEWDRSALRLKREFSQQLRNDVDVAKVRVAKEAEERTAALKSLERKDVVEVSASEWISSSYYTGDVEVWPSIKDLFVQIVEEKYNVIVLRGAAGWAKTFLGRLLIKRSIYEIGCKENPHVSIGPLSRAIPLRIALVHINKERAREELLDPLVTMIQSAGWYKDHFSPQTRLYGSSGADSTFIAFHHNSKPILRVRPVPTRPESVVGFDLVAAHLSECNKYDIIEDSTRNRSGIDKNYDAAFAIFSELRTRLLTRYYKPLATCIRIVLDSSERYEDDFLARATTILEKTGLKYIIVAKSNWETQPGKNVGPFFYFAKPRKGAVAEVVDAEERKKELLEDGREIVEIPVGETGEYEVAARQDPDWFARDVGGWPTDAISRWLRDPEQLIKCREARDKWLADRNKADLVAAAPEKFVQNHSRIDWNIICTKDAKGNWLPRIYPDRPRFIHIDLADTGSDYIGFGVGCAIELRKDGPILWPDLNLRIYKDGSEYRLDDIRAMVEDLRDHGFWIKLVTFDRYQSTSLLQQLTDRGFECERVSVHAPPEAYDSLFAAINTTRILLDAGNILTEELIQLEAIREGRRRHVRHRKGGHDDTSDGLAGWVWQATKHAQHTLQDPIHAEEPSAIYLDSPPSPSNYRVDERLVFDAQNLVESERIREELARMEEERESQKEDRERWMKMVHPRRSH